LRFITAYCQDNNCLADALRNINNKVSDRVLVLNVLYGLDRHLADAPTAINLTMP
jgi:hypothetical protein